MTHVTIVGERGLISRALQSKLAGLTQLTYSVVPTDQAMTPEGAQIIAQADLAVLAVQDFASPDIEALLPDATRILDVSPAFRSAPGWVYGLPELSGQSLRIASAHRVANPGCFATSAILLIAPLTRAGLLAQETPLYLDAVGGYSTGGSAMESKALTGDLPAETMYGLLREHRHVPEIRKQSGLTGPLWFMPKIANFKRGIRMVVPLPGLTRDQVLAAWQAAYSGTNIQVCLENPSKLSADSWAGRAGACLRVVDQPGGCLAMCVLDNLGKGGVDAAFDNITLMLGLTRI